jgi:hypothetical protein
MRNASAFRRTALILVLMLSSAAPASSAEARAVAARLCRDFAGAYQWHGDPVVQRVAIRFDSVRAGGGGAVEARGGGRYEMPGQVTDIRVRAVIDPVTFEIELWESDPSQPDFTTDGSHRGNLTEDLAEIIATWIGADGKQGELRLRAHPSCLKAS